MQVKLARNFSSASGMLKIQPAYATIPSILVVLLLLLLLL